MLVFFNLGLKQKESDGCVIFGEWGIIVTPGRGKIRIMNNCGIRLVADEFKIGPRQGSG